MSDCVVESVFVGVATRQAYEFIRNPANLPRWTNAFLSTSDQSAVMRTPNGKMEVGLRVVSSPEFHTVDWKMSFPDGSESWAWSRVVPANAGCFYSILLPAPPAPLEELEGGLGAQRELLREELRRLRDALEGSGD